MTVSLQIAAPTTRIYRGVGEDLRWFGVAAGRDRKAGDGGEKESAKMATGGRLLPILQIAQSTWRESHDHRDRERKESGEKGRGREMSEREREQKKEKKKKKDKRE